MFFVTPKKKVSAKDTIQDGHRVLGGMENFPLFYTAVPGEQLKWTTETSWYQLILTSLLEDPRYVFVSRRFSDVRFVRFWFLVGF